MKRSLIVFGLIAFSLNAISQSTSSGNGPGNNIGSSCPVLTGHYKTCSTKGVGKHEFGVDVSQEMVNGNMTTKLTWIYHNGAISHEDVRIADNVLKYEVSENERYEIVITSVTGCNRNEVITNNTYEFVRGAAVPKSDNSYSIKKSNGKLIITSDQNDSFGNSKTITTCR